MDVVDGTITLPTTAIENDGLIIYTLPANRRYSTAFEVETTAGTMENISNIDFSETKILLFRNNVKFSVFCHESYATI